MLMSRKRAYSGSSAGCEKMTSSGCREMRNRAEKMRRDRLNSYIGELASLVPLVSKSSKRMDKTSILRLTATHLRIYRTLLAGSVVDSKDHALAKQIDQRALEQVICDELGGFMLILTTTGKILFVSPTVENLLGYLQTDLLGQSVYDLTLHSDREKLRTYLNSYGDLETRWRKYFCISLKRSCPRSEAPVYETAHITSAHRPSASNGDDILILFVRLNRPEPISNRLLDASKDEYVTRHLVDGRIVNCDHRISLVAGYMTDEVAGLSAFKFMHKEDVRWVIIALRQMYDKGETKGSSCYRLISRNSRFIYLRTSGYLEVDDRGIVESFICINTLVDESEGRRLITEMKRRYSALVDASAIESTGCVSNGEETESVEDPAKIERAIVDLVRNLPSPSDVAETTSTKRPSSRNSDNAAPTAFKRYKTSPGFSSAD